MKNVLKLALISTVLLATACSPKKKDEAGGANAASADVGSEGSEHCMDGADKACFLDMNSEGRSKFYTTAQGYQALLTDPGVAAKNFQLNQITQEEYDTYKVVNAVQTTVYNGAQIQVLLDNLDANAKGFFGSNAFKNIGGKLPGTGLSKLKGRQSGKVGQFFKGESKFGKLVLRLFAGVGALGAVAGIADFALLRQGGMLRGDNEVSKPDDVKINLQFEDEVKSGTAGDAK